MEDKSQNTTNEEPAKEFSEAVIIATNKNTDRERFAVASVPAHQHGGADGERIPFQNIQGRFLDIAWTLPGTSAATAGNYGTFYTAQTACIVIGFAEVHEVAGTDAGSVTLQLERLQGTEAPGSGDNLLVTAVNLKGAINSVTEPALVRDNYPTLQNNRVFLVPGDRLALKDAGTLTAVAGLSTVTRLQLYP